MAAELRRLAPVLLALVAATAAAGPEAAPEGRSADPPQPLRVCADPNNLPFSNAARQGFENALAEVIARELDAEVAYTWWAQRRGFIRNTLNAGQCDVVMGVPVGYDPVDTTRPYYCSTYVFVHDRHLAAPLEDITDPRLRELTIGVHLTGDDGANPPPVHALGLQGIVDNVVGFMIYGDYRQPNPPARLVEAVASGRIDVAAVWGPIGGYFGRRAEPPLAVRPITGTERFALPFRYGIALGVRKGDVALRDRLQQALDRRRQDIDALLARYDLPAVGCEPASRR